MKKKLAKIGIIAVLLIVGTVLSFMCLDETHITSLLSYHDKNIFSSYVSGPLVPKQNIAGEFQATSDNLAMVKLRIRAFNRLNTTHIRFRLREKGGTDWIVSNTYTVDRFPDGLLYPFGFPAIADSKGREYEFMLESLDGTQDNAIGIDKGYHGVASQYVFQKSELLSDKRLLQMFLIAKAKDMFLDPYSVLYLSLFLIPAAVFLMRRFGLGLVLYMGFVYTYLPLSIHSNTILYIAALLLGTALYSNLTSSVIYSLALLFLVQIPAAIAFGNVLVANRAATLLFFFILIGGIISLKELRKK